MIHFSEFSGIGGFDLAAEWNGWKNYLSCEINPFGNRVLEYYWPKAYHHTNITTLTYDTINHELSRRFGPAWRDDDIIISGGFPCQPYSSAGKRLGKEDDRHLWPEMLRTIREVQPTWVVGENVRGLTNWNGGLVFLEVWSDLEALGYEVIPFLLPACAVDAPHRRDRIFFIAYSGSKRYRGRRHGHGEFEERAVYPNKQVRDGVWSEDSARSEVIANAASDRRSGQRTGFEIENREPKTEQSGNLARGFEGLRAYGLTPYTEGERFGETRAGISRSEERDTRACDERISSDSDSEQRREGRMYENRREEAERHFGAFDSRNGRGAWEKFPTQSPVRFGNDGFPSKLDGITVSKWHNESIKAAGNAIVPQVAYQIFQAIQQYQNNNP